MKKLATLVFLISAIMSSAARADCYTIENADYRNYCRAIEQRNVTFCYAIDNLHMRSMCIDEIRRAVARLLGYGL